MLMRLGTSPSIALDVPKTTSSSFPFRLVQAVSLACANIVYAADGKPVEPPHNGQETISTHVSNLNHIQFTVRKQAQNTLIELVEDSVRRQNPIADDVRRQLDPMATGVRPEQRARLLPIERLIADEEERQPSKVGAPREGKTCRDMLEDQFGMLIVSDNPIIENRIKTCPAGKEGQTSMQELLRLCQYVRGAPSLINGMIIIRPLSQGEYVRADDRLFHVMHGEDKNWSSTVFAAPDKEAILSLGDWQDSETVSATTRAIITYWKILSRSESAQFKISPLTAYRAIIAQKPEIRFLPAEVNATRKVPGQEIQVNSIENVNGKWHTIMRGEIDDAYFKECTSCESMIFMNDLIGKNHVSAHGKNNERLETQHEQITVTGRMFQWTVITEKKPEMLRLRLFTKITEMPLSLP